MFDVIIVGGGPAGISAGIYAHRAGLSVLVFDAQNSTLKQAKVVNNYYGVEPISGEDLINRGVSQFKQLGGKIEFCQVVGVKKDFSTNTFIVKTTKGDYESRAIILATGVEKKKIVKGLEPYEGKNVSSCAVCDGFFYKNKIVAVIGDKDFAISECEELSKVTSKTFLLTDGKNVDCNIKNVEVITKKIKSFSGKDLLDIISFDDGDKIHIDGCFVALGDLSSSDISKRLGLFMAKNYIVIDKNMMTNVAGVFACGDVVGGLLQVSKAVSDGAKAGLESARYIKMLEINEKG